MRATAGVPARAIGASCWPGPMRVRTDACCRARKRSPRCGGTFRFCVRRVWPRANEPVLAVLERVYRSFLHARPTIGGTVRRIDGTTHDPPYPRSGEIKSRERLVLGSSFDRPAYLGASSCDARWPNDSRTRRGVRAIETSHPQTYYVPRYDIAPGVLSAAAGGSFCE